jgi:Ca2+-binding RTX toxin-like protein
MSTPSGSIAPFPIFVDLSRSVAHPRDFPTVLGAVRAVENVRRTSRNDVIIGDDNPNLLTGGAGNGTIGGLGRYDQLVGSTGDDTLHGGDNDDTITGGAGDDRCNGGRGDDRVHTCELTIAIP